MLPRGLPPRSIVRQPPPEPSLTTGDLRSSPEWDDRTHRIVAMRHATRLPCCAQEQRNSPRTAFVARDVLRDRERSWDDSGVDAGLLAIATGMRAPAELRAHGPEQCRHSRRRTRAWAARCCDGGLKRSTSTRRGCPACGINIGAGSESVSGGAYELRGLNARGIDSRTYRDAWLSSIGWSRGDVWRTGSRALVR